MRQAIFDIGVERIDHGLDALDRTELIQGLVDKNIGLTLCPHAYHRRTATEVLFPKLRELLNRGVKFCINSDDPVYMHDVWISGNMEKAYKYCEFTKAEMVRLARNAVDMSWAEESVKVQLHTELDAVVCS
jgi:adenosine deaminase